METAEVMAITPTCIQVSRAAANFLQLHVVSLHEESRLHQKKAVRTTSLHFLVLNQALFHSSLISPSIVS